MSPKSPLSSMTEQWRLCRCSTSDYFLYPWVISNLRSTLSKRVDITRRTPMKITEFLLEEEADDNKNLRLLSLPHPARKGFGIITTFYLSLPAPSICFGWVCAESCWNMERLRDCRSAEVTEKRREKERKRDVVWSTSHMMCHSRWC